MRRRKLLIADDSEMNRAILANVLDQEFEVIEATNGQEVIIALWCWNYIPTIFTVRWKMAEGNPSAIMNFWGMK